MKKAILAFVSFLAAVSAPAETVSHQRAAQAAAAALSTTKSGVKPVLVWDGTDEATRGVADAPFYVFNNPGGGFVIISGEDAAYPILGWSDKDSFTVEGMPAHIKSWFGTYARQMEYLRESGAEQSPEVERMWKTLATPTPIKELHTARWGQDSPFNRLCPEVDGHKAVTGCVATAISEIMYHHKWPLTTGGNPLPKYQYVTDLKTTRTQEGHNLSSSYDWDKMKSSYNGSYTTASADAVASLIFDVGVMIRSHYNSADSDLETFGTSAYSDDVAATLIHYMGYDSSAVEIFRDQYTNAEWSAILKNEIDSNRPICYGGSGEAGGHQFVIDGYGSDDFFCVNWGWNGMDNGYFRMEALGFKDEGMTFSCQSSAIISIKPDEGGNTPKRIVFSCDSKGEGGLSLVKGPIAKGKSVKIAASAVCNPLGGTCVEDFKATIRAKNAIILYDKKGAVKETYGESMYWDLDAGYFFYDTVVCTFGCDLALGDKLRYCVMFRGDDKWTPISTDGYYINNNSLGINVASELGVFDFPAIYVNPDGYRAGEVIDLRIVNTSLIPLTKWYIDDKYVGDDVQCARLDTKGRHTIRAEVDLYNRNTYSGTKSRSETLVRVIEVR